MLKSSAGNVPAGSKFEGFTIKLADIHFDSKSLWEDNSNTHGDRVYSYDLQCHRRDDYGDCQ